jgi:hypothetical protein
VNVTDSILEPDEPAKKSPLTDYAEPSLADDDAANLTDPISGVSTKIGDVFCAILLFCYEKL